MIVGALNFTETLHGSKTIPKALEQYHRLMNKEPKNIFLDRGYRSPKKSGTQNFKRRNRKKTAQHINEKDINEEPPVSW